MSAAGAVAVPVVTTLAGALMVWLSFRLPEPIAQTFALAGWAWAAVGVGLFVLLVRAELRKGDE